MKRAVWLFEAGLSVILSIPLAVLPLQWALKGGEVLGLLLFYLWGSRRRIAEENLAKTLSVHALIIPEPVEKIIKDHFKNLGRSFAEVVKIYYGLGQRLQKLCILKALKTFRPHKQKEKGFSS